MDKKIIGEKGIKVSKPELKKTLEKLGLNYDISSIPDNAVITGYSVSNSNNDSEKSGVIINQSKTQFISNFKQFDTFILTARSYFRSTSKNKKREVEEIFDLYFSFVYSIGKFKNAPEWRNSRQEFFVAVLFKAMQTLLGIYYLCESGFFDLSLSLKRNYVELMLVGIAIGYDPKCFVDWKNDRSDFKDVHKIANRISESSLVPDVEKGILPLLLRYWNESSQADSHQVSVSSLRGVMENGDVQLGIKMIKEDVQDMRLNTIRNMLFNLISLMLGVFDYGKVAESDKLKYPEAPQLISKFNSYFAKISLNEPTT